jgi:hypothetical protein
MGLRVMGGLARSNRSASPLCVGSASTSHIPRIESMKMHLGAARNVRRSFCLAVAETRRGGPRIIRISSFETWWKSNSGAANIKWGVAREVARHVRTSSLLGVLIH